MTQTHPHDSTGHRLVIDENSAGRRAWPSGRTIVAWLVPFLVFLVITTIWAVDHIEDDLEDRVQEGVFDEYGVRLSDDQVDFDGRDGEIVGMALPAGVTPDAVADFLEQTYDRGGPREGDISDMTVVGTEAVAAIGSHSVEVRTDGMSMNLSGEVLTQTEYELLDEVGETAVGAEQLTNRLQVLDAEPATPGAADRIGALASAIELLSPDRVASGTATLTDDGLVVNAIARTAADKSALDALVADGGIDVSGDIMLAAPPTSAPQADVTTTTVAPATGPIDVGFTSDGSTITLTGVVLDDTQRRALVDAAIAEFGASNVVDELTVSGLASESADAGDRIGELAMLIGGLGDLTEASGSLTNDVLQFDGVAADADGQGAILGLLDGFGGDLTSSVTVATAPTEQEITTLQAALDELQDEIAANVVFDPNSDVITPTAAATLDKVAAAMGSTSQPVVLVGGHTDADGDADANLDLSARRAASVVEYLVAQGVETDRLRAQGFGETEPLVPNDTPENKQRNRRVAFTALATFDA